MAVAEHPTTWFEDITEKVGKFDPVILVCVIDELKRLASGEGRKARYAKVALEISGSFAREPCGEGNPDDEIVSAAQGPGKAVATVDSRMLGVLKGLGVKAIPLSKGRILLS